MGLSCGNPTALAALKSGETVLDLGSGGGFDVVRWLLDQGVPVDAPAPNRSTPLMMAARYGASESVELLLARGADPRPRNDRGMDAADFARGAGRDALAERLTALAAAAPRP